jgi:type VI secretion system secreted protein Hcp
MAAVDYFMKIDGIKGESTDAKHKEEIDVLSFSWGATQSGSSSTGGGGGAGKVVMNDFSFTKRTDKASPALMLACADGSHIKSVEMVARKAGKEQQEYLKYTFSDVLISSYQTGGSQGDVVPVDQVSLNFSKVEMEYKPQKADGTLDAAAKAGWNLKENKKA